MNKKILIFYTSIGLGHKSMAENIGYQLERAGFTVELYDAHKVQGGGLAKWGAKAHHFILTQFPFVWNWLHNTQWLITMLLPIRRWLASFNYNHVLKLLEESKPDMVISAHNTSSAIISHIKKHGWYTGLFGVTFSDYFLHRFWLFDNVDFYLANTEAQKAEMVRLGFAENKITVCGITLKEQTKVNVKEVRTKLQIPNDHKIILFSSGSQGIGLSEEILDQLRTLPNVTILIVCGKDEELKNRLEKKFPHSNVRPLGYYSPMDDLYAISDLYVSKPGGLSTAEALRWYLPMIIFYVLPGGEPLNYDYLIARKLILPTDPSILEVVKHELETSAARAALKVNPEIPKILMDPKVLVSAVTSVLENREKKP